MSESKKKRLRDVLMPGIEGLAPWRCQIGGTRLRGEGRLKF